MGQAKRDIVSNLFLLKKFINNPQSLASATLAELPK